jgi:sugar/nucleoside kinase (ribokinase family)
VIRARKEAVRRVPPFVAMAHGNTRELCEFADAQDLNTALRHISSWGAAAVVVHLGAKGAGFFHKGEWQVEPAVPARTQLTNTGCGDVLSVCMMLLHEVTDASVHDRLKLANTIVAEYMEGKRRLVPNMVET